MEKILKVKVPKGYEIDRENSTFECIKFKSINENLTYKDICDIVIGDSFYYINNFGNIIYSPKKDIYTEDTDKNNASYKRQLRKVLAINQLMNIANYYNGDWILNWDDSISCKYIINYHKITDTYEVDFLQELNYGCVCFKNEEDAQAVIDNPNFRSILDNIFKN